MKKLLLIGCCLLLFATCKRKAPVHPIDVNVIALQPIGPFDALYFVQGEVGAFFHKPVIIFPPIRMPSGALDTTKGERYSADSILRRPIPVTGDHLPVIVALTEKDIFTTVRDKDGAVKLPAYKYAVWGIFGLGDCPGMASVVSDFRLHTADTAQYHHRIRTIVLHELGHNFGLPHCPNPRCIMNDANEKIATIDKSSDDYCRSCRDQLGLP